MFRSKQQNNQPNREAPTTSESASPRAVAAQRGSRSAAPGRPPAARWQEGGGRGGTPFSTKSSFRAPLEAAWASGERLQAQAGRVASRTRPWLPTVPAEGRLGGRGDGGCFSSRGFGCAQSPCVLRSGPRLPLLPRRQHLCPANLGRSLQPLEAVQPAAPGSDLNTKG